MKKLTDILKNTPVREVCGDTAAAIGGLVYDSRAVKPGDCFFAVPGTQSDGHDYIPMAVEKGAAAIVCERMPADAAASTRLVPFATSTCLLSMVSFIVSMLNCLSRFTLR